MNYFRKLLKRLVIRTIICIGSLVGIVLICGTGDYSTWREFLGGFMFASSMCALMDYVSNGEK